MSESAAGVWRVAGHEHVVRLLSRSIEQPNHAYLFLGPRNVGKSTVAVELAMALNCLATPQERPCHSCPECRLIAKSGHPDVTHMEPNEKDNLLIGQARELRQDLALMANQGRWRVVIFSADRLTEPAADALLKTLEDPAGRVVFILTGHDLESIPETIVSRCRTVVFGFVGADAIATELESRGHEPDRARRLSEMAYGAPGWAIAAAEDEEMEQRRTAFHDELSAGAEGSLREMVAVERLTSGAKADVMRNAALAELELLLQWWRDVLVAVAGRPDLVVNAHSREHIVRHAAATDQSKALRSIRAISVAATRIRENVDTRLALEALAGSG